MRDLFKSAHRFLLNRVAPVARVAVAGAALSLAACTPFPGTPGYVDTTAVDPNVPCGQAYAPTAQPGVYQPMYDAYGYPKRNTCIVNDGSGHMRNVAPY